MIAPADLDSYCRRSLTSAESSGFISLRISWDRSSGRQVMTYAWSSSGRSLSSMAMSAAGISGETSPLSPSSISRSTVALVVSGLISSKTVRFSCAAFKWWRTLATSAGCILETMRSRLPMAPRRRRRPTVSRTRSNRLAVRPPPTGLSGRSALFSIRSIPSVTQFDEHPLVLAPRLFYLHPELQEDLHPEEVLHVNAGVRADRLQQLSLLADHDGFLGRLFNIHGRADPGEPPLLLERVDHDRHRERQLIARLR